MFCWLATVVLLAITLKAAAEADGSFDALVEWMELNGGRVNPSLRPGIHDGIRGVIAAGALEEGEELLFCPWKLVIGSTSSQDLMEIPKDAMKLTPSTSTDTNEKKDSSMCDAVLTTADEYRLKADSFWYPFLANIELPRLPAVWDSAALAELQGIAPTKHVSRHIQWLLQECIGEGGWFDEATIKALVTFISRACQVGLVPVYDLLNHHNGKRNAKLQVEDDGVYLHVVGGAVSQGDPLFLSYGIKTASTMYRDYAFIEEWPTFFNFQDASSGNNFAFVLFPDNVVAINPTTQFLQELYHSNMPLDKYQARARQHMESLPSNDLIRFAKAARAWLNALPTTLQEDTEILEQAMELRRQAADSEDTKDSNNDSNSNSDTLSREDTLSAIQYRYSFKEAVANAGFYCESMVDQRTKAAGTEL